jgi:site-specific DNA recombinase
MRKCHIYTMLANPLYAARIRAADEIVAATHPRIVDDNTFDLVQQKLKENTRNPGAEHRPKLEALLRGLLYCSGCGSATQQAHTQPVVVEIPEPICLSL